MKLLGKVLIAAMVLGIGIQALAGPLPNPAASAETLAHAAMNASSSRQQGYLGVDIRDLSEDQAASLRMKDLKGVEILRVDHDGPGCKAGLREHDIILQMNGQIVEGAEALRRTLHDSAPGRMVSLLIWRDGQKQTISTQMANREELERRAWEEHLTVPAPANTAENAPAASGNEVSRGFLSRNAAAAASSMGRAPGLIGSMVLSSSYTGAILEMMGPQLAQYFGAQKGLLVRSVDSNSPAAAAGMVAGDIVVRANLTPIATTGDWTRVIHGNKGRAVSVVVLRDKREQTLTLVPDAKRRSSLRSEPDGSEQASTGRDPRASME